MQTEPSRPLSNGRTWSMMQMAGLGMAAIWLFLAGIVGAIKVAGEDDEALVTGLVPDGSGLDLPGEEGFEPGNGDGTGSGGDDATDGGTGGSGGPGDTGGGGDGSGGGSGATGSGGSGGGSNTTQPGGGSSGGPGGGDDSAGDRTGISADTIKIGLHAPKSIGGAPLNLAEDPLKGVDAYVQYINQNGGINGRMLQVQVEDDRYETSGGADAARRLIEAGNFVISGTLGVDQISVVANETAKAGIPYHAAGGPESEFARLGVYQISTSYDTHVIQLARFLAKEDSYRGRKVGISALNSALMKPSVDAFKAEAARVGVNVVETVFVEKPTDQSSYSAEIQRLKDAGVEVFVPLQDPVTTSRMVGECTAALCQWRYTFSNFAHDGDTALTLFAGEWGRQKVRGLSGSCYYLHANAYDPSHCARMDKAHAQWVEVLGEAEWQENGQGGAAGYQIVSMIAEALRRAGADPTRQRYAAAVRSYDNFSDLVSSPITFAGRTSFSHGSDMMVVYEAQTDDTYRQITPGFVVF